MTFFEWDQSLQVNIQEIDQQHQKLINLLNDLHEAMKNRTAPDILENLITQLVHDAGEYFTTEENYFQQFGYPETTSHKMAHRKFTARIEQFAQDFKTGKMHLTTEIMEYLKDWLKEHIQKTDQHYAQYFQKKGVTFTPINQS
ncbi:MAG: hemerythrin family protein [Planctomycetes bacterium]|nr:hemerythrin family protein [Planctomycetota bacterium]